MLGCCLILELMDQAFLMLYIVYITGFLSLPVYVLAEYDLPPISTLVVAIEQVCIYTLLEW